MSIRSLKTDSEKVEAKGAHPSLPSRPEETGKKTKTSGGLWGDFKSLGSLLKVKGKEAAEAFLDSAKKLDAKRSDLDFTRDLREKNKTLLAHRLKHPALFPPAFYKSIAEKNREKIDHLESMVDSGIPLESAIKIIKPLVKDPHLNLLLDLELKKDSASPEEIENLFLETAEKMEASEGPFDGAWPLAAALYEEVLKEEREEIRSSFTPGELSHVRAMVKNEVWKRVAPAAAERISEFKKEDPEEFLKHYPTGEMPREDFLALVDRAVMENSGWIDERCELELKKLVLSEIDAKAEKGELTGAAATAWEKYDHMMDPLDKWERLSDESYDELTDQIAAFAATMPLSLGAGALVRAGVSVAVTPAVKAGLPLLAARGIALGSGSLATGITMEAVDSTLKDRDFDPKNALHNSAMDLIFHGSGKLWGKLAEKLEITGKAAHEAGAFAASSLTATAATYADPNDIRPLSERAADCAAGMAPFHLGMKFLNAAAGNLLGKLEAFGSKKLAEASLSKTYEIIKPPSAPRTGKTEEKTARIIDVGLKETKPTVIEKPFLLPAIRKSAETEKRIPISPEAPRTESAPPSLGKADATKVGRPGGTPPLKERTPPASSTAKAVPFEKAARPLTLLLDKYAINAAIKSKKAPELSYTEDSRSETVEVKVASWEVAEPVFAELRALKEKGEFLSVDLPDLKKLKEISLTEAEGKATLKSGDSGMKVKLRWILKSHASEAPAEKPSSTARPEEEIRDAVLEMEKEITFAETAIRVEEGSLTPVSDSFKGTKFPGSYYGWRKIKFAGIEGDRILFVTDKGKPLEKPISFYKVPGGSVGMGRRIFAEKHEAPKTKGVDARVEKAAQMTKLNARILLGERKAIEEAGVYYHIERESIGGNAGANHYAINAYVDRSSGKIIAVGNSQNIPPEIAERAAKVTFWVKIPPLKEILAKKGDVSEIIHGVFFDESLDPKISTSLKNLKGLPFKQPDSSKGRVIKGF